MNNSSTLTNRLRITRAEYRTSQRQLARKTGINETMIWKIENDYTTPTIRERQRIASAFGVPETNIWPESVAQPGPSDGSRHRMH